MRKQHHFWPGDEGVDAWDVDRLIDMSASLVREELPVAAIWEVDTVYWFDETQKPSVRKVVEHVALIEDVDLSYPIILGPDGRVMDGMHRVARAILEGRALRPSGSGRGSSGSNVPSIERCRPFRGPCVVPRGTHGPLEGRSRALSRRCRSAHRKDVLTRH